MLNVQWIGSMENLQENPINRNGKSMVSRNFSFHQSIDTNHKQT